MTDESSSENPQRNPEQTFMEQMSKNLFARQQRLVDTITGSQEYVPHGTIFLTNHLDGSSREPNYTESDSIEFSENAIEFLFVDTPFQKISNKIDTVDPNPDEDTSALATITIPQGSQAHEKVSINIASNFDPTIEEILRKVIEGMDGKVLKDAQGIAISNINIETKYIIYEDYLSKTVGITLNKKSSVDIEKYFKEHDISYLKGSYDLNEPNNSYTLFVDPSPIDYQSVSVFLDYAQQKLDVNLHPKTPEGQ